MTEILKFISFDDCAHELRVSPGGLKSLVNTGQLSAAQIHQHGEIAQYVDVSSLLKYKRSHSPT